MHIQPLLENKQANTLHENESDLDLLNTFSIKNVLNNFLEKKGTFIRLQKDLSKKITLKSDDIVYPACSLGFCRSQTLWALLKEFKDINLMQPHATRYGFDPYNYQVNWHRSKIESSFDEFYQWCSFNKSDRFGFSEFENLKEREDVSKDQLGKIRDYYTKYYYGSSTKKRRVYISFDKNTHVILSRLNESNPSLENVVVYHFPFGDKVTHPDPDWHTVSRSVSAYHHFSMMLNELIDYDLL